MTKANFMNFQIDHLTLLLRPEMYNVSYLLFRNIFGVERDDIIYEKRKEWEEGQGERSMTFAVSLGKAALESQDLKNNAATMIAVVQPTEPLSQGSHVRTMLKEHSSAAHWQHVALRTPDLLAFHEHAVSRGVNFITPILEDEGDDLIQVFSGEWYFPGIKSSAMFFEFVQRNPNESLLKKLAEHNRESWFRDETFLGLYAEKEKEYQKGDAKPFIDFELYNELMEIVAGKNIWDISEEDVQRADDTMVAYAKKKHNL